MDNNKIDILAELANIEGTIIGLEASAIKGLNLNEDGLIVNGIPMPKIEFDAFSIHEALNLGTEAAINKNVFSRMISRLNVMFSTSADSRMQKRAANLNLIEAGSINPGSSKIKVNKEAVNLFLTAWNYNGMRREDVAQTEALRLHLVNTMNEFDENIRNSITSALKEVFIGIPLVVLAPPIGAIYIFYSDIMAWYYLIMAILTLGEESQILGGYRTEFVRLVSNVVASCYMNGSGKTVKLDKDGRIPLSSLQSMSADIQDIMTRMNNAFGMIKSGTIVDYNDKVEIATTLRNKKELIQSKYVGPNNRKLSQAYNVMASNWRKMYSGSVSYSPDAMYYVHLADTMFNLLELSKACDNHLTTIVDSLYKM